MATKPFRSSTVPQIELTTLYYREGSSDKVYQAIPHTAVGARLAVTSCSGTCITAMVLKT